MFDQVDGAHLRSLPGEARGDGPTVADEVGLELELSGADHEGLLPSMRPDMRSS
jgi:hypothetical protein